LRASERAAAQAGSGAAPHLKLPPAVHHLRRGLQQRLLRLGLHQRQRRRPRALGLRRIVPAAAPRVAAEAAAAAAEASAAALPVPLLPLLKLHQRAAARGGARGHQLHVPLQRARAAHRCVQG
jgi:hypothetical protein